MSHRSRLLLLFALAAILLLLLIGTSELSWARFVALLGGVSLFGFLTVTAASAAQMAFGAWKWRIVTGVAAPKAAGATTRGFYMFYTSLGAVLGQFMPIQVSTAVARGGALRLHHGVGLTKGAATSIYEQLFDLIVPLLLSPLAVAALFGKLPVATWIGGSLVCLLVGGGCVVLVIDRLATWRSPLLPAGGRLERVLAALRQARDAGLFSRRILTEMLLLSTLRYTAHLARVVLVAWALGLDLDLVFIAQLVPLTQLALVLAFTPGSLGVAEWTWVGVLAVTGAGLETGAEFALLHRVLLLASLLAVLLPCGVAFLIQRRSADRGLPAA